MQSALTLLNRSPWIKRIFIPLIHLGALAAFFLPPSAALLLLGFVLYILRGIGITVGYHRYFTHESFRASRPVAFFLALLGSLSGQGTPAWWVARHRMHHRYTDRPGDPHSPRLEGFYHAHIGWLFRAPTAEMIAGEEALRAEWPRELRVLDTWASVLFVAQAIALYALGGWTYVAWGLCVPTVVSWHLTFLVNSLCHRMGDRPFATQDDSRNNYYFGAVMFGEGWHNNHHAWPKNARLGLRPSQIDLGYACIAGLKFLRLVWDVHEKSEEEIFASVKRYTREERAADPLLAP